MLVNISKKYMEDKYNFIIDDEKFLKKLTYQIMNDVAEECRGNKAIPLEKKNIVVLNGVKNYYIKNFKLLTSNKPNIQNLTRDKDIYGNRPINITNIIPSSSKPDHEILKDVTRIISDRESDIPMNNVPDINKLAPSTKDMAEDNEIFMKKLKELEDQRKELEKEIPQEASQIAEMSERLKTDIETHNMLDISKHDPKAIYIQDNTNLDIQDNKAHKELTINPKTLQSRIIEKYISISSQDRSWWNDDPLRYNYGISLNSRYRNINSITIGKVILPDEIIQLNNPVKPSFNYDFNMAFPYLLLYVDEFTDIYDGSNDIIRKSFCKLIFYKAYKGQNGRGYIILKPEQKEKKYFYPAPLSVLNKLSISIRKPSGQLFNKSIDNSKVLSITYDITKPSYLKITTNIYYDKNEFFVGDTIIIKNQITTFDSNLIRLNEFINRTEGHDILETSDPNLNGFYNSFYIECPGDFDNTTGQFNVNTNLITALSSYNTTNSYLMNLSLQNSISMKIDIIVDDAKILDTQKNFNF
jgi:hypothetical protein